MPVVLFPADREAQQPAQDALAAQQAAAAKTAADAAKLADYQATQGAIANSGTGAQFQAWLQRLNEAARAMDIGAIRARLQGSSQYAPDDDDVMRAALASLVDQTGASRAMDPMMRNWVMSQGANILNQRNLEAANTAATQRLAGNTGTWTPPEITNVNDYIARYFAGPRIGGATARQYTTNIANALGSAAENDDLRRFMYDSPAMQQAALSMGFANLAQPFREHASGQASRAYQSWLGGPQSNAPTFWEYLGGTGNRLPSAYTGIPTSFRTAG